MPCVNLHSTAVGHPKIAVLSDAAFRVWIAGLSYCQNHLTDGFIPEHGVYALGVKVTAKAIDELLAERVPGKSSLWQRVDGGYAVHDYLAWNDAAADVNIRRTNLRERVRSHRNKKRPSNGVGNAVSNALHNAQDGRDSNGRIQTTEHRPKTADHDLGAGHMPNLGGFKPRGFPCEVPSEGDEPIRANDFLTRFASAHKRLRNGSSYPENSRRDWEHAIALVKGYSDQQLEALIEVYMTARGDEFDGKQPTPGRMRSTAGLLEQWLRKEGKWPTAA